MNGRGVLAAIALVVATVMGGVGGPAEPAQAARPEALLVGDSVMNGLAQSYAAAARASLSARHSYILDTAGCRRLITTSCSIGGRPRPTNAIDVIRARAGQYERTLVVAAGYNDPPDGSVGIATAVDVILDAARAAGIGDVVWLTYREAGSAGNIARFRQNNAVLRSKLAVHPELRLADWNAASAGLPRSWFSGDGIHLGGQAAQAMADLIADALDETPSVRCRDGAVLGDAAPPPGNPGTAADPGRLQLLDVPGRLLDTRAWDGKLGADRVVVVPVAGTSGVPAGASAAMVSLVAVEPCADVYLTAYPCGDSMPVASALNAPRGATVANSALVAIGAAGAICVYASAPTDVIVDLTAVVADTGDGSAPAAPLRLVDTRPGAAQALAIPQERVGPAGLTVDVRTVLAAAGAARASALTVNLTAVQPAGAGFLSLLPGACAATVPRTSSLNVVAGRDTAAGSTVRLADGRFCVFSDVDTDVIVDLQAVHGPTGATVSAIAPTRMVDTRQAARPLPAGTEVRFPALVPPGALGAVVDATAVDPAAPGYVTIYPCGHRPEVSNVNVGAGGATANLAIVPAGAGGDVCAFASTTTHLLIDVTGWIG